jgi:fructose-1-phosphate kinase PfkB-like protein
MAGFLFGFLNGFDFERTLRLAAGAAASDCLSVGAGFINRAQALGYAAKARVAKLG